MKLRCGVRNALLIVSQLTKNEFFLLEKNSSSDLVRETEILPLYGATLKATWTSRTNLWPPAPTSLHAHSSRLACTARCMSASTKGVPSILKMPIWKNFCGCKWIDLTFGFQCPLINWTTVISNRPPETKVPRKSTSKRKKDERDLSNAMQSLSVTGATSPKDKTPAPMPPVSSLSPVVAEEAELYLWDMEKEEFDLQCKIIAQIAQPTGVPFEYWLVASDAENQVLAHKITSEMNHRWSAKALSITWNHYSDRNTASSWLFRFKTPEGYLTFKNVFTQAQWEGLHQMSWAKIKASIYPRAHTEGSMADASLA